MRAWRLQYFFIILLAWPALSFANFNPDEPHLSYKIGKSKLFLQTGSLYQVDEGDSEIRRVFDSVRVFNPPFLIASDKLYRVEVAKEKGMVDMPQIYISLPRSMHQQSPRIRLNDVSPSGTVSFNHHGVSFLARINEDSKVRFPHRGIRMLKGFASIGDHLVRDQNGRSLYSVNGVEQAKRHDIPVRLSMVSEADLVVSGQQQIQKFDPNPEIESLVHIQKLPDEPFRQISGDTILYYSGLPRHIVQAGDTGVFVAAPINIKNQLAAEVYDIGGETFILTTSAFSSINGKPSPAGPTLFRVLKHPYVVEKLTLQTEDLSHWIKPGMLGDWTGGGSRAEILPPFFLSPSCPHTLSKLSAESN